MVRKVRNKLAISVGRVVAAASRASKRGEGMVVGGRAMLTISPKLLGDLAGDRVWALVSSTNGKTSTTRLLATAAEQAGRVVTQPTGANMTAGIVSALATGPANGHAVLEVDEAYLPQIMSATHPKVLILGNLSRDQLDRMSEVAMIARKWRTMLAAHPETVVIANADDPIVVFAAQCAKNVIWVGAGQAWTADSAVCPECGELLTRGSSVADSQWSCPGCNRARPHPSWHLEYADGHGTVTDPVGQRFDLSTLSLPGRFNASNAILALVAAVELGLEPLDAIRRMSAVTSVSGRYAIMKVGSLQIRLLLAKNPAGWSELVDIMPPAPAPVIVTINSNAADGRDPSWLWDVPFERLRGRTVIATGERRADLAVRLLHAGVDHVVVEDPYSPDADLPGGARSLDVIDCAATYTAFHALRTRADRELQSALGAVPCR